MDDEMFLRQFETQDLPFAEWHHRAHVRVAYLYLRRHRLDVALVKVRTGIQAYNAAHKVPEGPDRGYHDTMTQAWVMLVNTTLCEYGPAETADAFLDQHPQLLEKKMLRFFYSKERMMSAQAKAAFVGPDLTPLPTSKRQG